MATRTELAIAALFAMLRDLALEAEPKLCKPQRNATLPTRLERFEAAGDGGAFLNLLDGDGEVIDEALGAGDGVPDGYLIDQHALIEWAVQVADADQRDALFDAGLAAIAQALKADRSLGDVVSFAKIEGTQRSELATEGLDTTRAIIVRVALSFTSDHPF